MLHTFKKNLRQYSRKCTYADLRFSETELWNLKLKGEGLITREFWRRKGIMGRVMRNDGWGVCHSNAITPDDSGKLLKQAFEMTDAQPLHQDFVSKDRVENLYKLEGICREVVAEITSCLQDRSKKVDVDVELMCLGHNGIEEIANTKDREVSNVWRHGFLRLQAYLHRHDRVFSIIHDVFTPSMEEYLMKDCLLDVTKKVSEKLDQRLESIPPPAEELSVILGGNLAGIFVHEVIGHVLEADFFLNQSAFKNYRLGDEIASPFLNIGDISTPGNKPFSYSFDSEGFSSTDILLIDQGRLSGLLHNFLTASKLGVFPTGHGRAQDYSCLPLPRIGYLTALPGKSTLTELIGETRRGLFLEGCLHSPTVLPEKDFFWIDTENGYLVENGRLKAPLQATSISGKISETIRNIDGFSNDYVCNLGAPCSKKGQTVFNFVKTPAVKIKLVQTSPAIY